MKGIVEQAPQPPRERMSAFPANTQFSVSSTKCIVEIAQFLLGNSPQYPAIILDKG